MPAVRRSARSPPSSSTGRGTGTRRWTEIAEEVGIKKASLYYYFPSKDGLLIEMHDEMIELIIARTRRG